MILKIFYFVIVVLLISMIIKKEEIGVGDIVEVSAEDGTILCEATTVTAISPCKQYIQTELGSCYLPAKQVRRVI